MKRQPPDDWGTALGSDPEGDSPKPQPKTKRDTPTNLINYFSDLLPKDAWGKLNSPVNAPALMTGIKKLRDNGHSNDDIRSMMRTYISDISRKPLPNGVAPWRGFLANLDALSTRVTPESASNYDDLETDRRFQ